MILSAVWFGLTVAACCSLAGPVGRMLGVIDYPDGGRKSHARPTPMVGGIALMLPLLLVAAVESTGHIADGDIFDGRGPAAHWSAGSRRSVASGYGRWLGWLAAEEPEALLLPPASRLTPALLPLAHPGRALPPIPSARSTSPCRRSPGWSPSV